MTCMAYIGLDTEDTSGTTISWTDPAGQHLSNDSDTMVTIYKDVHTQNGLVFLESILEICSVSHTGQFSCSTENSIGSESFNWTISFTTGPQLVATLVNQDINYGDTVLSVCVGSGFPELKVNWSRNGELLDPASSDRLTINTETISEVNFTMSILKICGVGDEDVGSFSCTIISDGGTVTGSPFTLAIRPREWKIIIPNVINNNN